MVINPASLKTRDAARYLGISRATLFNLMASGELTPKRIGTRLNLWRVRDLDRFLESKKTAQAK